MNETEKEQRALDIWMLETIRSKIRHEDGHMIWTGSFKQETGYPYIHFRHRGRSIHIQVRRFLCQQMGLMSRRSDKAVPGCLRGNECVSPLCATVISHSDWMKVCYELRRAGE